MSTPSSTCRTSRSASLREFPASPFDGDLAEMDAAGLVTEGVGQLIEGEAAVQDRAYPRLFERSDIILLLAPAADHKSLQARLLGHQIDGRHFTLSPGQHANQRDMAPYAHRCDGLVKRAGAANLNDMIYAASREVSHPLPPVRDLAIVDHMVGAEGADTFQLLVRRRRGDNRRTHHLRDLQRGD